MQQLCETIFLVRMDPCSLHHMYTTGQIVSRSYGTSLPVNKINPHSVFLKELGGT